MTRRQIKLAKSRLRYDKIGWYESLRGDDQVTTHIWSNLVRKARDRGSGKVPTLVRIGKVSIAPRAERDNRTSTITRQQATRLRRV